MPQFVNIQNYKYNIPASKIHFSSLSMENILFSPLSIDKLISRQGLLVSLDKSLNQLNVVPALRFPQSPPTTKVVALMGFAKSLTTPQVVRALRFPQSPSTTEVVALTGFAKSPTTPQAVVGSMRFSKLPPFARKTIAKFLKEVAEFIWENAEDLIELVKNLPDKEEEEPEHLPQLPAPAPSTAPAPLVHKTEPWLPQLFKGRVPLDFHHTFVLAGCVLAGFAAVALAVVLFLFPKTAKVSVFSKGEAVLMYSEVSNNKRFAGIFFQLDGFSAQMIDYFLRGPFSAVGDGGETCVRVCTLLSNAIAGSFILCLSSKKLYTLLFVDLRVSW